MQLVGTAMILMMAAFWAGHTHKVKGWEPRPPEQCQMFDTRYAPRYEAMCDRWDAAHP